MSPGGPLAAFIFQNGTATDLNTLIPADSGWILHTARGINNLGQIVGDGEFNGIVRGFVLTPPKSVGRGGGSGGSSVCARLLAQYDLWEGDLAMALQERRDLGPYESPVQIALLQAAIAGLVREMRGAGCLTGVLPPPGTPGGTIPKAGG